MKGMVGKPSAKQYEAHPGKSRAKKPSQANARRQAMPNSSERSGGKKKSSQDKKPRQAKKPRSQIMPCKKPNKERSQAKRQKPIQEKSQVKPRQEARLSYCTKLVQANNALIW
jgi:hypothetical protein